MSAIGSALWVERNTRRTLNPEQARCVQVLCSFAQPYNLPLIRDGWAGAVDAGSRADMEITTPDEEIPVLAPVVFGAKFLVVRLRYATLSTYDFPELTRLVVAAHEHAVRVEVGADLHRWIQTEDIHEGAEPLTEACLRLSLHAREREGDHVWERHPTMEEVLTRV